MEEKTICAHLLHLSYVLQVLVDIWQGSRGRLRSIACQLCAAMLKLTYQQVWNLHELKWRLTVGIVLDDVHLLAVL
jgi:hypothetical protein